MVVRSTHRLHPTTRSLNLLQPTPQLLLSLSLSPTHTHTHSNGPIMKKEKNSTKPFTTHDDDYKYTQKRTYKNTTK